MANANVIIPSGAEITDVTRKANIEGDGRAWPDYSYGIYGATTNKFKNGGFETNTTFWAGQFGGSIARLTSGAKFGNACLQVTGDGSNGAAAVTDTANATAIPITAGNPYTASAWIKADAGRPLRIGITTGNNTATGLDNSQARGIIATGDYQRITVTLASAAVGAIRASLFVGFDTNPGAGVTLRIDGVQFEDGLVATPYKETNGATATRAAAFIQANAGLLMPTQSWFAACMMMGFNAASPPSTAVAQRVFSLRGAGSDILEGLYLGFANNGQAAKTFQCRNQLTGIDNRAASAVQTFVVGNFIVVLFSWTAAQIFLSLNGGAFVAAARSAIQGALTQFTIGSEGATSTTVIDSTMYWAAGGYGVPTLADSVMLAALGTTPPTFSQFSAAAKPTFIWPAETAGYFSTIFGGLPDKVIEPSYSTKIVENTYKLKVIEAAYKLAAIEGTYKLKGVEPAYSLKSIEPTYKITGVDIEY